MSTCTLRKLIIIISVTAASAANGIVAQTTTLHALRANNTAAANTFTGSVDPRPGVITPEFNTRPGNVSSEDPHALIRPGYKGLILVSFMPWFNPEQNCTVSNAGTGGWGPQRKACSGHIDTGYKSTDPAQIHRQMDDIESRHFDGIDITWHLFGKANASDDTSLFVADLNARCGVGGCPLKFVIMPDHFAECKDSDAGARQDCLLKDLEHNVCYLNKHYFDQPSYLKVDGHPVWQPFINPGAYSLPSSGPAPSLENLWEKLQAFSSNLADECRQIDPVYANSPRAGVPYIELQNNQGFGSRDVNGAYFWLVPARGTAAQRASVQSSLFGLQKFYETAIEPQNAPKNAWGGVFAKFNDVLAGWSQPLKPGEAPEDGGMFIEPDCGRTWLRTFDITRTFYASHGKPFYIQVETWNDYDEGTEIETGIDNCLADVPVTISGHQLSWTLQFEPKLNGITGDDSTIARFDIYASEDGETMRLVGIAPPTRRSIDLSHLQLPSVHGRIFVQAVGKPSIQNHISQHSAQY